MILILVPSISSRMQYTAEVIFKYFSGTEYKLTTNKREFLDFQGDSINYTDDYLSGIKWIKPCGLLFEESIHSLKVETSQYLGIPLIFPCSDSRSFLPFDVFAAVFYMISRYEEYLPFKADAYGRFPATASLAFQHGFLNIPVVEHWVHFLTSDKSHKKFTFCSTIDIDVAFAYKHKGYKRNAGGLVQSFLKADFQDIKERILVLTGIHTDPYDTYDFIEKIHAKYLNTPKFFILFSDYGPKDKNLAISNKYFQTLIKKLASLGEVGIHPSFGSKLKTAILKKEISDLSLVIENQVIRSRQHFLLLSFPDTYKILIECGIKDDYSMGFADKPGFRAGTSLSYPFYNLKSELQSDLIIHPFAVMEGTLKDYLQCTPAEASKTIQDLVQEVYKVKGSFTMLWHNESLSDKRRWKGWKKVFEDTFSYISSLK